MARMQKSLFVIGDSISQGGARVTSSGMTFAGSGTTGTITGVNAGYPGQRIYISNASASHDVWNGMKTVSTVSGSTITFTNSTELTASPTANADFSGIFVCQVDYWSERNFQALACFKSALPFDTIDIYAGSGRRSDHVYAEIEEVLAQEPDAVSLLVGINDVMQDKSEDSIFDNINQIVSDVVESGAKVFLGTLPPLGTASGDYSAARRDKVVRLNARIRLLCARNSNVFMYDAYKAVTDPVTGDWLSNYTADGVHPSSRGAYAIALEFAAAITTAGYTGSDPRIVSQIDSLDVDASSLQLIDNPLMQGTSGQVDSPVTGTSADDWRITRYAGTCAIASSLEARSDGIGQDIVLTITSTAASDQARIYHSPSIHSDLTAGDVIEFVCSITQESATNLRGRIVYLEGTVDGNAIQIQCSGSTGGTLSSNVDGELVFRTQRFTVPANLTALRPIIRFEFGGTGGGVFKFGRASVRKIKDNFQQFTEIA